jgi:hypothetical protein
MDCPPSHRRFPVAARLSTTHASALLHLRFALGDDARGLCVGERIAKREDQITRMRAGKVVWKRGGGRRHANE